MVSSRGDHENGALGRVVQGRFDLPIATRRLSAERALKLITFAPADTEAVIAAARSSGLAAGITSPSSDSSTKIGRNKKVQSGQMAGLPKPRFAAITPTTAVPWKHAIFVWLWQAAFDPLSTSKTR
jgi:hypothetical protein